MNESVESSTPANLSEATYSDGGLPPSLPPDSAESPTVAPATPDELKANDAELDKIAEVGKRRHRAKSQQAGPEDVPRIRELTKKLRETEDRLKEVEARTAPKPAEAPKPRLRELPKVEETAFTKADPKLEDFADQPDPYAAWMEAKFDHKLEKREFEANQARAKQEVESVRGHNQAEMRQWFETRAKDFGGRLDGLIQEQPEAKQILEAAQSLPLTEAMHAALLFDQRGERVMLHIAQNLDALQSQMDELYLLTDGKPVTETLVALVQRRMNGWMHAAGTGSAAPALVRMTPAPRPPNPVRTAPSKPIDGPPADDSPLSEHEKAFPVQGRRR